MTFYLINHAIYDYALIESNLMKYFTDEYTSKLAEFEIDSNIINDKMYILSEFNGNEHPSSKYHGCYSSIEDAINTDLWQSANGSQVRFLSSITKFYGNGEGVDHILRILIAKVLMSEEEEMQ